jgi:hypothetical protein
MNNHQSINESSIRAPRDRSDSFDQSTISTNKLLQRHAVNMNPNDLVELRSNLRPGQISKRSIIPKVNEMPVRANEELKDQVDRDIEVRNEEIFTREFVNMREEMAKRATSTRQNIGGEDVEMRRVHVKDLSQIFKSKNDIYKIFTTSGQLYLPPFEDCTLDYLRGLMNSTKKVRSI